MLLYNLLTCLTAIHIKLLILFNALFFSKPQDSGCVYIFSSCDLSLTHLQDMLTCGIFLHPRLRNTMQLKAFLKRLGSSVRAILTFLFALAVLGVMIWAYVEGFQLVTSAYGIISFGFYGLLLSLHVFVQSLFAYIEHRRMKARTEPCSYTKTIGFTISAYQEDPVYLRQCLDSIKALMYPPELLRIIMVIDGNSDDDQYMMDMFREVFADRNPGCYVWENNYHTWNPTQAKQVTAIGPGGDADYTVVEDPQRKEVEYLIQSQNCVCIMQKWGGKREVMYTAFKALGSSVDYIQVNNLLFSFTYLMYFFLLKENQNVAQF